MKKTLLHMLLLCVVIAASALSITPAIAADKPLPGKLQPGDTAPARLGVTRARDEIETTQFAGRVMVVTFWASWCGPCRNEMVMLEKLQILAKDRLKIVAVNIEEREVFREVSNALKDFTITITNDPKKYAAQNYGVKGIPHMVIIGKDGKVVTAHAGYSEAALDGLLAEINAELAKG